MKDIKEILKELEPGRHIIQTPDQRGDGYDIACSHHDEFTGILEAAQEIGATVEKLYANGFFCGYIVDIPEDDEMVCLCKHSGQWGPWYHKSLYRRKPGTKSGWIFVCNLGGHYSYKRARKTGLLMGRPGVND